MELINMHQAVEILGDGGSLVKEDFSKKFGLTVQARTGDGKGKSWFYDRAEVEQRADELRQKEADKVMRQKELVNHPAAVANRFVASDLMEGIKRVEVKLDKLLEALGG